MEQVVQSMVLEPHTVDTKATRIINFSALTVSPEIVLKNVVKKCSF